MERYRHCLLLVLIAAFWIGITGCSDDDLVFDTELSRAIGISLNEAVDQYRVPGAVISIIDPAGARWTGTSGLANLETGETMTADLRFYIGSNTKPFTAIVVLQLVDEGRIELDAPIGDYLPGLITRGGDITVRLLLNMRSGLGNYGANPEFTKAYENNPDHIWTAEELVQYSNYTVSEPGERFKYNNANYIILGLLIEKTTGRTYEEAVVSRIVSPLGLDHTSLPTTADMPIPHAHGYRFEDGEVKDLTMFYPVELSWAAGVIVSNVSDMLVFLEAFISGSLLSKEMFLEQWTLVPTGRENITYGLAAADMNGSYGHTGSYHDIFTSAMFHRNGYKIVVLCNGQAEGGNDDSTAAKIYFKIVSDVGI